MRVAVLATVPAMLIIAACSDYVLAVFGEEWTLGGVALKLLAIVGIAKALVFFSGPLLFALGKTRLPGLMLWVLAAASAATVVLVAIPLQSQPESDQLLGMAASRAVLFVLVVIPVNLAIISRLTGLTAKELLRGTPAPLVAGLVAVGAVAGSAGARAARRCAADRGADHHPGSGDCDHARRPDASRRLGTARRARDVVQGIAVRLAKSTVGRAGELHMTVSLRDMSGDPTQIRLGRSRAARMRSGRT